MNDEDMKMLKDNIRRMHDLEKTFKIFVNNANFDHIKSDINKLNEQIGQKLNSSEISDLKENTSKNFFFK